MFVHRAAKGGDPCGPADEPIGLRGEREAQDRTLSRALTHTPFTHRNINKSSPSLKGLNFVPVKTHLI